MLDTAALAGKAGITTKIRQQLASAASKRECNDLIVSISCGLAPDRAPPDDEDVKSISQLL
jgi:hypothetical protein